MGGTGILPSNPLDDGKWYGLTIHTSTSLNRTKRQKLGETLSKK